MSKQKRVISSILLTAFMATTVFSMTGQVVYGKDLTSELQQKDVNISQSMKAITEDVNSNEIVPAEIIEASKINTDKVSSANKSKKLVESKNEILVKYKSKSKANIVKENILKNKQVSKFDVKNSNNKFQIDTIEIGESDNMKAVLEELQKNADVLYAQPNYELNLFDVPGDSRFNEQWNLLNDGQAICGQTGIEGVDINVLPAWDIAAGGETVVIGILDSGVDTEHLDLNGNIYVNENEVPGDMIDNDGNGYIDDVNGWNFYDNNANVFTGAEFDSHGTHVAGIVAAVANETGIRGVASNVKILPLKFINGNSGTTEDALNAIEYASGMGVKIINASFGSTQYNPALEQAMNESGILFVTAAGNIGVDCSNVSIYPACFEIPTSISVAATDNRGNLASFSSYGSSIDVACPGVNILSTLPNDQYGLLSGTSMAAPQVAGIAALIMGQNPELTSEEIIARIKNNVVKSNKLEGKVNTSGRVDALAALIMLLQLMKSCQYLQQ